VDQGEYSLTGVVTQNARAFDSMLQRKVELKSFFTVCKD